MHWTVERAQRENAKRDQAALREEREQRPSEVDEVQRDTPDEALFHSILFDEYAALQPLSAKLLSTDVDPDAVVRETTSTLSSSSQLHSTYQ